MSSGLKFEFFMSQIRHIQDIKENEKTKLSIVFYEITKSSCILRICKGRDLSDVCRALKEIRNINVASVYDYVYQHGNTYIIEENLCGLTLEEAMARRGLFSEDETARIAISLCNGLKELHRLNPPVVHNDINVSNVMICHDNNVKLFDFDISRVYKKGLIRNTTLLGTEEYASPEHFGYGQSQPRTDIYSLGVTMHKMLTGRTLTNEHELLYSGGLKKIIETCTRVNAEERYYSVDILEKHLKKFLNRRKRLLTKLVAVAGLLIMVVFFAVYGFSGDEADKSFEDDNVYVDIFDKDNSNPIDFEDESEEEKFAEKDPDKEENDEDSVSIDNEKDSIKRKTANQVLKLDGELLSMIALNDGTMLCLEQCDEDYYVISSDGDEKKLSNLDEASECRLIYNGHSDEIYVVVIENSPDMCHIYPLSRSLKMADNPKYSNAGYSKSNFYGVFITESMLYCNVFRSNMIKCDSWTEYGDIDSSDIKFGTFAIIGDFAYSYPRDYTDFNKMTYQEDVIDEFIIPLDKYRTILYYRTEEYIYFMGKKDDVGYVCRFDGDKFEDVICLADYRFYTGTDYDDMCVGEKYVWAYDRDVKSITEFKIS